MRIKLNKFSKDPQRGNWSTRFETRNFRGFIVLDRSIQLPSEVPYGAEITVDQASCRQLGPRALLLPHTKEEIEKVINDEITYIEEQIAQEEAKASANRRWNDEREERYKQRIAQLETLPSYQAFLKSREAESLEMEEAKAWADARNAQFKALLIIENGTVSYKGITSNLRAVYETGKTDYTSNDEMVSLKGVEYTSKSETARGTEAYEAWVEDFKKDENKPAKAYFVIPGNYWDVNHHFQRGLGDFLSQEEMKSFNDIISFGSLILMENYY